MGSYWRDLLAWQQIVESDVRSPVGGGLVQLCQQDPSRVYLCISVATISAGGIVITTSPSTSGPSGGIPLLSNMIGSNGAVEIDLNAVSLNWESLTGVKPSTFNAGTGAGTYGDGTIPTVSDMQLGAGGKLQFLMTFPGFIFQHCSSVREFEVARHGALAQAAWWAYDADPNGNNPLHVVAVRQESGPCDSGPLKSIMAPAKPQNVSWLDSVTNGSNANGEQQPRPTAGKQSLLVPNWDDLGTDSRP